MDTYSDFSLSIEYSETGLAEICDSQRNKELGTNAPRTYLQCSSSLTISILKKLLALKLGLKPSAMKSLDVMYDDRPLSEELSLLDVAYIYAWRRTAPMRLFYRAAQAASVARGETTKDSVVSAASEAVGKPVLTQIDNKMSELVAAARQEAKSGGDSRVSSPEKKPDKFAKNNENCECLFSCFSSFINGYFDHVCVMIEKRSSFTRICE